MNNIKYSITEIFNQVERDIVLYQVDKQVYLRQVNDMILVQLEKQVRDQVNQIRIQIYCSINEGIE